MEAGCEVRLRRKGAASLARPFIRRAGVPRAAKTGRLQRGLNGQYPGTTHVAGQMPISTAKASGTNSLSKQSRIRGVSRVAPRLPRSSWRARKKRTFIRREPHALWRIYERAKRDFLRTRCAISVRCPMEDEEKRKFEKFLCSWIVGEAYQYLDELLPLFERRRISDVEDCLTIVNVLVECLAHLEDNDRSIVGNLDLLKDDNMLELLCMAEVVVCKFVDLIRTIMAERLAILRSQCTNTVASSACVRGPEMHYAVRWCGDCEDS